MSSILCAITVSLTGACRGIEWSIRDFARPRDLCLKIRDRDSNFYSRVSNMFDAGFSVPRLLSGLYQLFDLCWIKHVLTVWPLTSINQHAKGLDKREMFGDQTPSNIVW